MAIAEAGVAKITVPGIDPTGAMVDRGITPVIASVPEYSTVVET